MHKPFLSLVLGIACWIPFSSPAQVLNVLNLNKASSSTAAGSVHSPPPPLKLTDYTGAAESNYNLVLADTTLTLSPAVNLTAQANSLRQLINQIQDKKRIHALQTRLDELENQLNTRNKENRELRESKRNENLTQLQLLRGNFVKNKSTYSKSVEATGKNVDLLEAEYDTYWKAAPPLPDAALVFSSDSARYVTFNTQVRTLRRLHERAREGYATFLALEPSLTKLASDLAKLNVDTVTNRTYKTYNDITSQTQVATDTLKARLDAVAAAEQRYNEAQKQWTTKFNSRKDKQKTDNITALPGVVSVPGTRLVIPEISGIGSRRFDLQDDNSAVVQLRLFTALGSTATTDKVRTTKERGTERLFLREASSFGFSTDVAYAFAPARKAGVKTQEKLAVLVGGAYLEKLMTPDSLHTFSSGVITSRIGLEYSPVPRGLSFYANLNTLSFLTNTTQVRQYYTNNERPKDMYGFVNVGVKALLTLDKDKSAAVEFELGFVLKGDNVRLFVPNDDLAITVIKATLIKGFALD